MPAMYIEQVGRPSAVAALDPRAKLLFLLLASTLILVWESLFLLGVLGLVVLVLAFAAGLPLSLIRRIVLVMLPAILLILLIQGQFSPYGATPVLVFPPALPWLGGHAFLYREGLLFGLVVALRLLIPILAFPLVVMTTEINDLVTALTRCRIPFKVAFLISTTLRFVPFIFAELEAIKDAQRLRGLAIETIGPLRRIRVFGRMLVPLILSSLTKAQTLEMALQARGFSGSRDRTFLNEAAVRLRPIDVLLLFGLTALGVGAIFGRALFGWGSFR